MTPIIAAKAVAFAVPTGASIGALDLVADPHFSSTITLGSVLLGLVVMTVAGIGAVRSQISRNYRESWESEKTLREEKEGELARLHEQTLAEREEQRQVRHALKNDLATARAQIAVLDAKTDFTAYEQRAIERNEAVLAGLGAVTESLQLIARQLTRDD